MALKTSSTAGINNVTEPLPAASAKYMHNFVAFRERVAIAKIEMLEVGKWPVKIRQLFFLTPTTCLDFSMPTNPKVPATSHGDKSHRVNWPFLLQNLVAGTNFSPCD